MKLVQYHDYLVSTVAADGLVLYLWGIRSHSAEQVPVYVFPAANGLTELEVMKTTDM